MKKGAVKKNITKKDKTLKRHLKENSNGQQLYLKYKEAILDLDPRIMTKTKKFEMGFRVSSKIFTDIAVFKKFITIWLNVKKGNLFDPKNIAEDVSDKGHWGNGDYQLKILDTNNFGYVIGLIKQALDSRST